MIYSKFEHTVGSHSDDRGGDSDLRCDCQDKVTDPSERTPDLAQTSPPDYKQEIEKAFDCEKLTPGTSWDCVHGEATICDHTYEKLTHLINKARIDELEWVDDKFDSLLQATEDGDRVHPGEFFEAIQDRIKELEK